MTSTSGITTARVYPAAPAESAVRTGSDGLVGRRATPTDVAPDEERGGRDDRDAATRYSTYLNASWNCSQFAPAAHPAPANAKHQIAEPSSVSQKYGQKRAWKTPAGIEMNERTTGVIRPRKTAQPSQRSNQRSARSSFASCRDGTSARAARATGARAARRATSPRSSRSGSRSSRRVPSRRTPGSRSRTRSRRASPTGPRTRPPRWRPRRPSRPRLRRGARRRRASGGRRRRGRSYRSASVTASVIPWRRSLKALATSMAAEITGGVREP